jgi:hypothetical protein
MEKPTIYQRLAVEDIIVPKSMKVSSIWAITEDGNQIELDYERVCFEDENSNEINIKDML